MTASTARCAHAQCKCSNDSELAVTYEGKTYCSERCADGRGCDHHDCNCGVFPTEEAAKREPSVARHSAS
jgi:hypothetical protein